MWHSPIWVDNLILTKVDFLFVVYFAKPTDWTCSWKESLFRHFISSISAWHGARCTWQVSGSLHVCPRGRHWTCRKVHSCPSRTHPTVLQHALRENLGAWICFISVSETKYVLGPKLSLRLSADYYSQKRRILILQLDSSCVPKITV